MKLPNPLYAHFLMPLLFLLTDGGLLPLLFETVDLRLPVLAGVLVLLAAALTFFAFAPAPAFDFEAGAFFLPLETLGLAAAFFVF